jgi:hypothetical protein
MKLYRAISPSCPYVFGAGQISEKTELNKIRTLESKSRNNTKFHCTVSSEITRGSLTRIGCKAIDELVNVVCITRPV